jgi:Cytidylate kinase-like family
VLIRGWGAAALFQGIRGVICVRVCAPMASRVAVMMERLGTKDADAVREEIESFDATHARAMRAAFNFDWDDALLYHMVLNTARVPIERAGRPTVDEPGRCTRSGRVAESERVMRVSRPNRGHAQSPSTPPIRLRAAGWSRWPTPHRSCCQTQRGCCRTWYAGRDRVSRTPTHRGLRSSRTRGCRP